MLDSLIQTALQQEEEPSKFNQAPNAVPDISRIRKPLTRAREDNSNSSIERRRKQEKDLSNVVFARDRMEQIRF